MNESRFLVEVRATKNAVTEAEDDLAKLLNEIRGALRAEKLTNSEPLQEAFDKLRAAREHLVTLEKMARDDE